jgi:hypothetical protein
MSLTTSCLPTEHSSFLTASAQARHKLNLGSNSRRTLAPGPGLVLPIFAARR